MTLPVWYEEPIAKQHDRKAFDCGDAAMNAFLHKYARQSHDSGGAKTFAAIDAENGRTILGFYSVAPASIAYANVPAIMKRGLAQHDIPGFRLARLATDVKFQGEGLGGQLLALAARRCILASAEVGGVLLIIDAKNERAAKWYTSWDAIALEAKPLTLFVPLARFAEALKAAGQL